MTVVAGQGWAQHDQVKLAFVQSRLRGFASDCFFYAVAGFFKCCGSLGLGVDIAFAIKYF